MPRRIEEQDCRAGRKLVLCAIRGADRDAAAQGGCQRWCWLRMQLACQIGCDTHSFDARRCPLLGFFNGDGAKMALAVRIRGEFEVVHRVLPILSAARLKGRCLPIGSIVLCANNPHHRDDNDELNHHEHNRHQKRG